LEPSNPINGLFGGPIKRKVSTGLDQLKIQNIPGGHHLDPENDGHAISGAGRPGPVLLHQVMNNSGIGHDHFPLCPGNFRGSSGGFFRSLALAFLFCGDFLLSLLLLFAGSLLCLPLAGQLGLSLSIQLRLAFPFLLLSLPLAELFCLAFLFAPRSFFGFPLPILFRLTLLLGLPLLLRLAFLLGLALKLGLPFALPLIGNALLLHPLVSQLRIFLNGKGPD